MTVRGECAPRGLNPRGETAFVEPEGALQIEQTRLAEMLRPYQRDLNRRQRLADFVTTCIRSAERGDFFSALRIAA